MKTTIIPEETKKELPFPKLMIGNNEEIVFFIKPQEGMVLKNKNHFLGYYSAIWDMDKFKDFYGSITMSNL